MIVRKSPDSVVLNEFAVFDPQLVEQTNIADIWKVTREQGDFAALKIYHGRDMLNEAPGFEFLKSKTGIGVAHIYQTSGNAALLEWLDGPSLGDMVRLGKDCEAAALLVELANKIHDASSHDVERLPKLEEWYEDVFNLRFADDVAQSAQTDFTKCRRLAEKLFAPQQDIVQMHGDFHHDNVKLSARGYLAFDAKGVEGERTYELANAFRNPLGADEIVWDAERFKFLAKLWSKEFDVDHERLVKWAVVKCAWSISRASDGEIKNHKDLALLNMFIETAGL